MRYIDIRSDTVTQPTQKMRDAMYTAVVGDDVNRDDPTMLELEELAAKLVGKEAAMFVPSGTMGNQVAIACYDTLEEVVGLRGEGHGSLKEWGVTFRMQELAPDGHIDFDAIPAAVQGARVAYIQRSRGYTLRPSVTVAEIARVVELDVLADRTLVTSVTGDGVIVATPTGSTAYSMAAGGPIVEPTSQAIIVTPVCAHRLTARAMVLSMDRVVTIALPKTARKCLYLSVDGGKAIRLNGGDRVEVKRSRHSTQLVQLTHRNFYQLVNQKLGGAAQ